jgi:hypothetical protein
MADPYEMAATLLDRVVDFFTEHAVTLPAVRYVAPGNSTTVAFDDDTDGGVRECVMVAIDYLTPGQPGNDQNMRPPMAGWMPTVYAEFAVLILRRAAVANDHGVAPTPETIQKDAQTNLQDLRTLHAALGHIRDSSLQPDGWAPRGSAVAVGRTQTVGPMGAAMAAVGLITAEVTL